MQHLLQVMFVRHLVHFDEFFNMPKLTETDLCPILHLKNIKKKERKKKKKKKKKNKKKNKKRKRRRRRIICIASYKEVRFISLPVKEEL